MPPSTETGRPCWTPTTAREWSSISGAARLTQHFEHGCATLGRPEGTQTLAADRRELREGIWQFAAGLRALGLEAGNRVGLGCSPAAGSPPIRQLPDVSSGAPQVSLFAENSGRWTIADQGVMLNGAADAVRHSPAPACPQNPACSGLVSSHPGHWVCLSRRRPGHRSVPPAALTTACAGSRSDQRGGGAGLHPQPQPEQGHHRGRPAAAGQAAAVPGLRGRRRLQRGLQRGLLSLLPHRGLLQLLASLPDFAAQCGPAGR